MQAVLSQDNQPSRTHGLKAKLLDEWSQRCGLIRHADQPAIQFEKAFLASAFQTSECFRIGMCVCRRAPADHRHAQWLHGNILRLMKRSFWSRKKEKSDERKLLEDSRIIIGLSKQDSVPSEDDAAAGAYRKRPSKPVRMQEFFHVGYVNFKTWQMSVLHLVAKPSETEVGHLLLPQLAGESSDDEADAEAAGNMDIGAEVSTLLEALVAYLEFECSYSLSFWKMRCSGGCLPDVDMRPGIFEVEPLQLASCAGASFPNIWKGSTEEEALRRPKQRRSACCPQSPSRTCSSRA